MKVCPKCEKVISYNSYFQKYICSNCGYEEEESDLYEFEYMGYTFIPVGKINPDMSLKRASLYLRCNNIGLSNYGRPDDKGWDYNDFYNAATALCDACDVFQCKENRLYYIPCNNEMMVWEGNFIPIEIKK